MYAVYRAKRYVQHPGNLLPSTVVKVPIAKYQLLIPHFKCINGCVDFSLEPYKVCDFFRHIPLNGVDFLKASDKRSFGRLVWIVVRFKIAARDAAR